MRVVSIVSLSPARSLRWRVTNDARPLGASLGDIGRFGGLVRRTRRASNVRGELIEGVRAEQPAHLRGRQRRPVVDRTAVAEPQQPGAETQAHRARRDRRGVRPRPPRVRARRDPRRRTRAAVARAPSRARRAAADTRRTIHAMHETARRARPIASQTNHGTKSIDVADPAATGRARSPSHSSGPRKGRGAGSRAEPAIVEDVARRPRVRQSGSTACRRRITRASCRPRASRPAGRSSSARRTPRRGCAGRSRAQRWRVAANGSVMIDATAVADRLRDDVAPSGCRSTRITHANPP